MRFSILLPSAEGKASGGNPLAPDMFDYRSSNTFNFFSELNIERRKLIDALQSEMTEASEADLEALLGVKGENLAKAREANLEVYSGSLMAAIDRYSPGVMYKATEFTTLPTGAQRRLLENGIIFSGLFGLLRPDDLIPNYKLKMGATVPGIGKVSAYWREPLSEYLNRLLTDQMVWNLLPGSFDTAWDDAKTYARMVRVQFVKEEGGVRKPLTHGVKELRGALVAHIVTEVVESVDALRNWEAPDGYEVDEGNSEIDESGSGTVVMVSSPGWEERRAERRRARAAEAAAKLAADEEE